MYADKEKPDSPSRQRGPLGYQADDWTLAAVLFPAATVVGLLLFGLFAIIAFPIALLYRGVIAAYRIGTGQPMRRRARRSVFYRSAARRNPHPLRHRHRHRPLRRSLASLGPMC